MIKLKDLQNKKVGLTITGGAFKAVAHIGLLKALEEKSIKLNSIVGSSSGAIIASEYALGKTTDEIYNHFKQFNPYTVLNPLYIAKNRKLNFESWEKYASKQIAKNARIEDSKIKLAIHVVDRNKGDSVYLTEGNVIKSVVASSAFISSYKYKHRDFIDGDYDPEVARDIHEKFGSEIIIVGNIEQTDSKNNYTITQKNAIHSELELNKPDLYIEINLKNQGIFSKRNLERNFEVGYKTSKKILRDLK